MEFGQVIEVEVEDGERRIKLSLVCIFKITSCAFPKSKVIIKSDPRRNGSFFSQQYPHFFKNMTLQV